jgi:hypothetical protein
LQVRHDRREHLPGDVVLVRDDLIPLHGGLQNRSPRGRAPDGLGLHLDKPLDRLSGLFGGGAPRFVGRVIAVTSVDAFVPLTVETIIPARRRPLGIGRHERVGAMGLGLQGSVASE